MRVKGVIMSLALHYLMGDAHHCSGPPVSEMTYTVSSETLNPSIPYHTIPYHTFQLPVWQSGIRLSKNGEKIYNLLGFHVASSSS